MKAPNFRTLDLNLLRVFDAVMSERNLTRAARNLSMTQPAVSNALSRLRDALGDRLVVRSGYGVEPTPRALALWPSIADALRQLEKSIAPGEFIAAEATNTFTLAMADATAAELMPGLVAIMERDAPGITSAAVASAIARVKVLLASAATNSPGVSVSSSWRKASLTAGHSARARGVGSTP